MYRPPTLTQLQHDRNDLSLIAVLFPAGLVRAKLLDTGGSVALRWSTDYYEIQIGIRFNTTKMTLCQSTLRIDPIVGRDAGDSRTVRIY